jgi:hypothetical protein
MSFIDSIEHLSVTFPFSFLLDEYGSAPPENISSRPGTDTDTDLKRDTT